jgi:foldase protein PrsA
LGQAAEEAAAVVNGEEISREQLVEALLERVGPGLLEQLIQETLVQQALTRKKITLTPQEVDDRLAEFKEQQFASEEEFQTWLTQRGVTLAGLRKQVELDLGVEKLVRSTINISDADVQREHERIHKQVTARHIVVTTEAEARGLRRRLLAGADFAELAEEYSTDGGTRKRGGELGRVSYEAFHPAFAEALFSLKKGEISEPVRTPGGYHLIQVESIDPAPPLTPQDKAELRERLIQEQLAEKKDTWLSEALAKAKIERKMFQ